MYHHTMVLYSTGDLTQSSVPARHSISYTHALWLVLWQTQCLLHSTLGQRASKSQAILREVIWSHRGSRDLLPLRAAARARSASGGLEPRSRLSQLMIFKLCLSVIKIYCNLLKKMYCLLVSAAGCFHFSPFSSSCSISCYPKRCCSLIKHFLTSAT